MDDLMVDRHQRRRIVDIGEKFPDVLIAAQTRILAEPCIGRHLDRHPLVPFIKKARPGVGRCGLEISPFLVNRYASITRTLFLQQQTQQVSGQQFITGVILRGRCPTSRGVTPSHGWWIRQQSPIDTNPL
jgi:hypothetical protein